MAKKTPRFLDCTIMRVIEQHTYTLNIVTGKRSPLGPAAMVTMPCGVPLFGGYALIGVCRGCMDGWEAVPGNVFASPAERERAAAAALPAPQVHALMDGKGGAK